MHNAQLSGFVDAVIYVYTLMIIVYIVMLMLPLPYNRVVVTVREFLEQTVSPFLRLFRRFIPPIGPVDLSPMIAIISLFVLRGLLASAGI